MWPTRACRHQQTLFAGTVSQPLSDQSNFEKPCPQGHFALDHAGRPALEPKLDITLSRGGRMRFVPDTKWKHVKPRPYRHPVAAADAYRLIAQAKRYASQRVAAIYPRVAAFHEPFRLRFGSDTLKPFCFCLDAANPQEAVG